MTIAVPMGREQEIGISPAGRRSIVPLHGAEDDVGGEVTEVDGRVTEADTIEVDQATDSAVEQHVPVMQVAVHESDPTIAFFRRLARVDCLDDLRVRMPESGMDGGDDVEPALWPAAVLSLGKGETRDVERVESPQRGCSRRDCPAAIGRVRFHEQPVQRHAGECLELYDAVGLVDSEHGRDGGPSSGIGSRSDTSQASDVVGCSSRSEHLDEAAIRLAPHDGPSAGPVRTQFAGPERDSQPW
jgi:hypothetical protein